MKLEDRLSRSITDQLDEITPPPPDLARVVRRGRSRAKRRNVGAIVACVAVLGGGLLTMDGLLGSEGGGIFDPQPEHFEPVGQLDFTDGLRAYMSPDPDGKIWLGGRSFPAEQLDHIDTDATATPYGMVYFDRAQRAHLLREDGTDVALAPAPDAPSEGFHPSSKADARLPLVAWTKRGDGHVTIRLYDLSSGRTVATADVPCDGGECSKVVVDGMDQGLVFVRTSDGTHVWDSSAQGDARWTLVSGPETRVADVRNKRILHTGPAPTPAQAGPIDGSWSYTRGEIDAQLSHDGGHVLYWSTRLEPTTSDGEPIQLDAPKQAFFVTFDTDGSVLVAVDGAGQGPMSTVYDCELPSGRCAELGELKTANGDPIFIGNDM